MCWSAWATVIKGSSQKGHFSISFGIGASSDRMADMSKSDRDEGSLIAINGPLLLQCMAKWIREEERTRTIQLLAFSFSFQYPSFFLDLWWISVWNVWENQAAAVYFALADGNNSFSFKMNLRIWIPLAVFSHASSSLYTPLIRLPMRFELAC